MKLGRWTTHSGPLALLLAFLVAGGPVAGFRYQKAGSDGIQN